MVEHMNAGDVEGSLSYFAAIFTPPFATILLVLLAPVSQRLQHRAWERERRHQAAEQEDTELVDDEG